MSNDGNVKRPKGGVAYHVEPQRSSASFNTTPSVGQSKPYKSGDNAHGKHQARTKGPAPGAKSGHARSDGPNEGLTGK